MRIPAAKVPSFGLTITDALKGLLEEKEKGGGTGEKGDEGNLYTYIYICIYTYPEEEGEAKGVQRR
jgi:hypothetical protein